MTLPRNQFLTGDATATLRTLPNASIDMALLSPPYFNLRLYGSGTGELGQEVTVEQWVDNLDHVMTEIRRVLVPSGTVWLNVGDAFAIHPRQGAPRKSLLLGPERLALRLIEHGWLLRSSVVWQKGVEDASVPNEVVSELPRIRVETRDLPTSGMTYWDGDAWVIALNRREPTVRRRFTLFHEYKHIIDHGRSGSLYTGSPRQSADRQAEHAADYFAGCALIPRTLLKRAWGQGTQDPLELARLFDVSERAVEVRLSQVGLVDEAERHPPSPSQTWKSVRGRYYRPMSELWLPNLEQEQAA